MPARKKKVGRRRNERMPFKGALVHFAAEIAACRELGFTWEALSRKLGELHPALAGRSPASWRNMWSALAPNPSAQSVEAVRGRMGDLLFGDIVQTSGTILTNDNDSQKREMRPPVTPEIGRVTAAASRVTAPPSRTPEGAAEEFARRFFEGGAVDELLPTGSDLVKAKIFTGMPELLKLWSENRAMGLAGKAKPFDVLLEEAKSAPLPALARSAKEWTARFMPKGGGREEMEGWIARLAEPVARFKV